MSEQITENLPNDSTEHDSPPIEDPAEDLSQLNPIQNK